MGLIEQAKADIEQITSDLNGFGVEMTLTAPTSETAIVVGLHTKHHLGFDTDGNKVSTKNAHISISEKFLIDANYPVRVGGKVALKNHRVAVADSTGNICTYIIKEVFPNETIGLITCILGDFRN